MSPIITPAPTAEVNGTAPATDSTPPAVIPFKQTTSSQDRAFAYRGVATDDGI